MEIDELSSEFQNFVSDIKGKIRTAQYESFKAVNKELINLYWSIGEDIAEKQEKLGWGKGVVTHLAEELQKEFPGTGGFSTANIWRMRNFYNQYSNNEKLAPLVREISWTKNIVIMEKCKDDLEREFYIKMTRQHGWTKDVLIHQIEFKSYEKYMINQTNFENTISEKYSKHAILAVKDEYNFDFLEINEEHLERELEKALIENIRKFLIEMGGDFCFIGSQYRVEIDENEYFIDLLLYNRRLKALVAIELKAGEFKPEYAGKMQFYLSVLNDKVRLPDENPSIGIIICKSKKRTIVEYALKDVSKPIGVSTYSITDKLPEEISKYLPTADELTKRLESFTIGNGDEK